VKEKVLITGASGLIAKQLGSLLERNNFNVYYLSTSKKKINKKILYWDYKIKYVDPKALQNVNHIIHLAGFNITKPWSKKNKKLMYDSRVKTSHLLFQECEKLNIKPISFISASAMGYYGFNNKGIKLEEDNPGKDWMSKLCVDWEKEADKFKAINSRVIKLRLSLILDQNSEIIKKTILGFRFGTGTIFGSGEQPFPWTHIKDVIKFILFILQKKSIYGVFNLASPEHITNYDFINTFKKIKYKKSLIIHLPKPLVNIILGEKKLLIFNDLQLSVEKIKKTGFKWSYPTIHEALEEITNNR
tara:strand:+ start:401 stop:1306 length:906 start_codon:yes stop_codon:yes gene_type:complete